jgi:hypothetical protein
MENVKYWLMFLQNHPIADLDAGLPSWLKADGIEPEYVLTQDDPTRWVWLNYYMAPWRDATKARRDMGSLGRTMLRSGGIMEACRYWPPKDRKTPRWRHKHSQLFDYYYTTNEIYQRERREA